MTEIKYNYLALFTKKNFYLGSVVIIKEIGHGVQEVWQDLIWLQNSSKFF